MGTSKRSTRTKTKRRSAFWSFEPIHGVAQREPVLASWLSENVHAAKYSKGGGGLDRRWTAGNSRATIDSMKLTDSNQIHGVIKADQMTRTSKEVSGSKFPHQANGRMSAAEWTAKAAIVIVINNTVSSQAYTGGEVLID